MEQSKLEFIAQELKRLADELINAEISEPQTISNKIKELSYSLIDLETELKGAVEADKVYPVIAQLIGSRPKDR